MTSSNKSVVFSLVLMSLSARAAADDITLGRKGTVQEAVTFSGQIRSFDGDELQFTVVTVVPDVSSTFNPTPENMRRAIRDFIKEKPPDYQEESKTWKAADWVIHLVINEMGSQRPVGPRITNEAPTGRKALSPNNVDLVHCQGRGADQIVLTSEEGGGTLHGRILSIREGGQVTFQEVAATEPKIFVPHEFSALTIGTSSGCVLNSQ